MPIFLLPFSRDIQIDEGGVALLERQLQRCVAAGGCFCIAREHRASLLLKQQVRCRCCGCTIVALDTEACVALIELFTPSSCHVQVLSVALRCLRKQLCADCALACRSAQVQQSAQHPYWLTPQPALRLQPPPRPRQLPRPRCSGCMRSRPLRSSTRPMRTSTRACS